jgi:hypothetical protein
MSSGHDVSEYELGASGLPRAYVSPQQPWKNVVVRMFHHNNRGKKPYVRFQLCKVILQQ